jgi:membrane associated rhomboid family serine protease
MSDQPPAGREAQDAVPPAPPAKEEPRFPELTFASIARYPVTSALALAAIGVSLLAWGDPLWADLLLADSRTWAGQFWRPAASALAHGDPVHLAFNLYWLWVFGPRVEAAFGTRAAAGIFLLLAAGPSCAQHALSGPGIGLSGVGYGLFGLSWVLSWRDERFRRVMDGQTVALFVAWFLLCIVMTEAKAWNVGNVAHAAGAALGLLLGLALAAPGRRLAWAALAAAALACLVGSALRLTTTSWRAATSRRRTGWSGRWIRIRATPSRGPTWPSPGTG